MHRASFFQRIVSATSAIVSHVRARLPFEISGWSLQRGLTAALACCGPVLAAAWLGRPSLSFAALVGFWVFLVDPVWPPRARLLAMGGYVGATTIGCFIASLLGPYLWWSGAFALIWCTAAILTRVWGNTSGLAGNVSALAVIVALGDSHSSSIEQALAIAAATLGGGLWGLVLALAIIRRRPDAALRGALAAVFRSEAAFVRDLLETTQQHRGAMRDALENARRVLVAARRETLGDGALLRRLSLMLGDGEQVLRALLALRETLEDVAPQARPRDVLANLAARLDALAKALVAGNAVTLPSIEPLPSQVPTEISNTLKHALSWTVAASRHLEDPAEPAVPGQAIIIEDEPIGWLAQLRNNLTFDSLSMRHALRFALTAASLTILTKALALPMGYWITLTATIILQAYPSATWQRAIERVAGTLAGGVIATAAAYVLHGPAAILIVIAPLSFVAMAARGASYALYMVCITPMFVLITELFSNDGVISPALAGVRMIDNVSGAAAGMLATFVLWPSWESRYLRRRLADDIRSHGAFLMTALDAWQGTATLQQADTARRLAGLAGNNAEASIRRAFDEPHRRPADELAAAIQITAAARRLAGIAAAIMQSAPPAGDGHDLGERRKALEAQLDDVVNVIALEREPTATPPPPGDAHEANAVEELLTRAERQLTIAGDAALQLAVDRTRRG